MRSAARRRWRTRAGSGVRGGAIAVTGSDAGVCWAGRAAGASAAQNRRREIDMAEFLVKERGARGKIEEREGRGRAEGMGARRKGPFRLLLPLRPPPFPRLSFFPLAPRSFHPPTESARETTLDSSATSGERGQVKLHRPPTRAARLGRALLLLLLRGRIAGRRRRVSVLHGRGSGGSSRQRDGEGRGHGAGSRGRPRASSGAAVGADDRAHRGIIGRGGDVRRRPARAERPGSAALRVRGAVPGHAARAAADREHRDGEDVARTVVTVIRVGAARVMPVTDWEHRQPLASGPPTNAQA